MMKINNGYVLRRIQNHYIIIGEGMQQVDMRCIYEQSPSAAFLWRSVQGKEFSQQHLASLLIDEYGITPQQASEEAAIIVRQWLSQDLITINSPESPGL